MLRAQGESTPTPDAEANHGDADGRHLPEDFYDFAIGQSAAEVGPYLMSGGLVAQRDDSHRLLLSLFTSARHVVCMQQIDDHKNKLSKLTSEMRVC